MSVIIPSKDEKVNLEEKQISSSSGAVQRFNHLIKMHTHTTATGNVTPWHVDHCGLPAWTSPTCDLCPGGKMNAHPHTRTHAIYFSTPSLLSLPSSSPPLLSPSPPIPFPPFLPPSYPPPLVSPFPLSKPPPGSSFHSGSECTLAKRQFGVL